MDVYRHPKELSLMKKRKRFYESSVKHFLNLPLGIYRKTQRLGGCHKSRCLACHYSKIFGFLRREEILIMKSQEEQVKELQQEDEQ